MILWLTGGKGSSPEKCIGAVCLCWFKIQLVRKHVSYKPSQIYIGHILEIYSLAQNPSVKILVFSFQIVRSWAKENSNW